MFAHALPQLRPFPTLPPKFSQQTLNLLVVFALLWSLIAPALAELQRVQPIHFPNPVNETAQPSDFDLLALPSSQEAAHVASAVAASKWRGNAEIVSLRDAFTRYYDMGDGQTAAVTAPDPIHYQDTAGNWQTIDPRFSASDEGYAIRADTLQTRLSNKTSAALFQHGESMLGWMPSGLTVLDKDGQPISTLATPLDDVGKSELSDDGQTVTFSNHWSDGTLRETFVSHAGQVEQSLIFAHPPQLKWEMGNGNWVKRPFAAFAPLREKFFPPKWLAFETELHLLSGDVLYVDGIRPVRSFSTLDSKSQTIEIRDAAGNVRMALAPVLAYEEANPTTSVQGHYDGEWLDDGVWKLRVVTPWSWWADEERRYPAVLDPTVYVDIKNPVEMTQAVTYSFTGAEHDCGIYLNSDDAADHLRVERAVAFCDELPNTQDDDLAIVADKTITSKVDFSHLPSLPTDADITGATLVLEGMVIGEEYPIEVVNAANNQVIHRYNLHPNQGEVVESCQGQGCDLTDSLTTNFVQEIELPADQVIPVLEAWYGGDNQGLLLRPETQNDESQYCGSRTIDRGVGETNVRSTFGCSFISTAGPRLYVHYSERTLNANSKIFNQPIPSFDDAHFGRTYHQYRTGELPQDWSAVAVIGDAVVDGAPINQHVRTPLEVMGKRAEDRVQQTNNRTVQYVVLDNTSGILPSAAIALVNKHPDNFRDNFSLDNGGNGIPGAHYDVMWSTPHNQSLDNPTPAGWTNNPRTLNRSTLVNVLPFDLPAEHTLSVKVTTLSANKINVELYAPDPGSGDGLTGDGINEAYVTIRGKGKVSPSPAPGPDNTRIHTMDGENLSQFPQRWALTIAHDGVNTICPQEPPGVAAASINGGTPSGCPLQVVVEMLACPKGEYPTDRFGCQPIIYPHAKLGGGVIIQPLAANDAGANDEDINTVEAANAPQLDVPRTSTHDVGGVRIFSEGGFVGGPFGGTPDPDVFGTPSIAGNSYQICTVNEDRGMPLLGTVADDSVPALASHTPSQRLTPVRQGSVCVTNENKIEIVGTKIPGDLDGRSYGAIVAPSIRENEARPVRIYNDEEDAYHGRIDTGANFGSLMAGGMVQDQNDEFHLIRSGLIQTPDSINPWLGWVGMPQTGFPLYIDIADRSATGEQDGTVIVTAEPNSPLDSGADMTVDSMWMRRAKLTNPGFEIDLDAAINVPDMSVVSMDLRVHGGGQAHIPTNGNQVAEIRLTDATIHQRENLGGAHKPAQAVISKTGEKIRTEAASQTDDDGDIPICGASRACLDVRRHDDIKNADWVAPDVMAGGETGSLIVQAAGMLQVYSNDHPDFGKHAVGGKMAAPIPGMDNAGLNNGGFEQSFNFKTYSGSAVVTTGKCGDEENVDIVMGETKMSVPAVGSDGLSAFEASYKICANKFREARIFFNIYPPGVPVGASGLTLESLEGEVVVDDDYVQITLGIGFRTVDGATVTKGSGKITIDTRGLVRLQAEARLVGVFSAQGTLAVAWNPLDILIELKVTYKDFFAGGLRMHMWRGQGFGNAYPWLPDNNDTHFTGTIGAEFTLKKGRIGKFWKVELPPTDIIFGVEVSFGEFCASDDCTKYEWGVQGKLSIMKFTVGAYISKSGANFFIGDKGKKLIDEFGGLVLAASISATPAGLVSDIGGGSTIDTGGVEGACPVPEGVATCTFEITEGTGEMMISAAWAEGTLPTAMLRTPGGTQISAAALMPQTDPQFGDELVFYEADVPHQNGSSEVQFYMDEESAVYTVANPEVGTWTLTLEDLSGNENYSVFFAANSPAPELSLTTPNNVAVEGALDVQWSVTPADTEATVRFSYISETEFISYTQGIEASQPISAVIGFLNGTPISADLPANQGSYQWQPIGLPSGEYRIVGRIDHSIHGSSYAVSPGRFVYTDNTPPAVPSGLLLTQAGSAIDGGVRASWVRNSEADLAAYQVVYSSPNLDAPSGFVERRLSIPPSDETTAHPTQEVVQLAGLIDGSETAVCVQAIDGSGNVSACSAQESITPQKPESFTLWTNPTMTNLNVDKSGPTLIATWDKGLGNAGTLLSWGYGCGGTFSGPPANEGSTNLDVGAASSFNLTGLRPGTYRVVVRGYSAAGKGNSVINNIGPFSNVMSFVLTDGVDGDLDGLPDDWATWYGVENIGLDQDNDFATNQFELAHGTDPTNPDSDGDGILDGREIWIWNTDACDPNDYPTGGPILSVTPDAESFFYDGVVNESPSNVHRIRIRNRRRGTLNWEALADQPWIKLSQQAGGPLRWFNSHNTVEVTVDVTGLEAGYHEGKVTVSSVGDPARGAPREIPVRLWVQRNRVEAKTRVGGYIFLDENGNGVEDPTETQRIGGVAVQLLNKAGAVMRVTQSNAAQGRFDFSTVPYASYTLRGVHADYEVTTQNPLPVPLLTQENGVVQGLAIGMKRSKGPSTDTDGDGIPDKDEDVNGDGNLENDDTDRNGTPDYKDPDDDGDGIQTKDEDVDQDGNFENDDTDRNGTPNYRDPDDDGDGILTKDEDVDQDGNFENDDTDTNGTPNYRDPDDDGDGTPTRAEGSGDADQNGTLDYLDKDFAPLREMEKIYLPVVNR